MEKQKQKKEDLLDFAGNYRILNILGCALAAISAVLGVVPFLYIWLAVKNAFIAMTTGGEIELISLGIKAVLFAISSMLIYAIGLFRTHISAFRTAKNLRSTAAMVSPIVAVILLFVFDWRLGLISLVPFAIGMVFMGSMMGEKTMEAMGKYQNTLVKRSNHVSTRCYATYSCDFKRKTTC